MKLNYNTLKRLSKSNDCFNEVSNFLYRYATIEKDLRNETERNTYFKLDNCFAEVVMINGICQSFSYQIEPYKILPYIN